jgi:hypothetical protein
MNPKKIFVVVMALLVATFVISLAPAFAQVDTARARQYDGRERGKLFKLERRERSPDLFKPPNYYAGVPYTVFDLFAADFDNDDHCDLAVSNERVKPDFLSLVTIFKNRGDGAFDTTGSYYSGYCGLGLSSADYDNDGYKDLAVANTYPCPHRTVSILENDGTGAFYYPYGYDTYEPYALFSADFDKDSSYDIAATISQPYIDSVAILWNRGDGWFDPAVYYYTGGYTDPRPFAADFNGDTYPDLAITNQGTDNLCILINEGDRGFQYPVCYPVGNRPWWFCGADLDNDEDCDLVIATEDEDYPYLESSISVFKNNGDGTFYLASNYVMTQVPTDIVTADFDLDGDFDLAFTDYDSVFVWLNAGDGTFQPVEAHFLGDYGPLVASDLNGDGAPDLAVARVDNHDVAILINNSGSEPIPTLSEWGLITVVILLMGTAVWMIKRKRLATERNN